MNEEIAQEQPAEQPVPEGGQPQEGQGGREEQMANMAMEYIYGNAETFSAMIEMIKSNKSAPEKGIAEASVMIIEKLEADQGELSVDELTAAGSATVMSLLDLAEKAGVIQEVSEEIGSQAWGQAIQIFMKKYPGRIDPAMLEQIAQESGAQPGAQEQPAEPQAAAPEPQQGLLEA